MHGYKVDFHDAHAHHDNHTQNHHASEESSQNMRNFIASTGSEPCADHAAHHGPTFNLGRSFEPRGNCRKPWWSWQESGADQLVSMVESGEISFADKGNRRFWSNCWSMDFSSVCHWGFVT